MMNMIGVQVAETNFVVKEMIMITEDQHQEVMIEEEEIVDDKIVAQKEIIMEIMITEIEEEIVVLGEVPVLLQNVRNKIGMD